MRLDLHAHSRYSPDSRLEPVEIVKAAKARGMDGIAITDHNTVEGVAQAREYGRSIVVLVVRGTEVSAQKGHILAYGVAEALPRDRPCTETVEAVLAVGGVPVAAHPYRFWSGLGESATLSARFAAYEVHNARTLRRGNERASALADRQGAGRTGGSDSHFLHELGRGVTSLDRGGTTVDDVLQALASRKTLGVGLHRGPRETAVYVTKCVGEWVLRGMRRI